MQILFIGKSIEGYDCHNEFKSSSNVLKYFAHSLELVQLQENHTLLWVPHTDSCEVLNMKLL